MENIRKILFLSDNNPWSIVAKFFSKKIIPPKIEVYCAETNTESKSYLSAVSAVAKYGIDISDVVADANSIIETKEFDLIVTFNEGIKADLHSFKGIPSIVNWNLNTSDLKEVSSKEKEDYYLKSVEKIKQLVYDLFYNGYFAAFSNKKINTDNILNSLPEGFLAHDLNRKIFYFSEKAEELTGLDKNYVIGKDCHEIFKGGMCGENCSFCEGSIIQSFKQKKYPVSFTNNKGEKKECDFTVVPLLDENSKIFGVAASLSDNSMLNELRLRNQETKSFRGIIGNDKTMLEVFQQIKDVADYNFPVHIFGETGTGKELVAAAIHNESPRRNKPFVPVNCGALPESLIESEIFGHVKGAFSGAVKDKKGRFELADGGTIFLDEIGELSKDLQVKLLRFLQEGTFEKVGGEKTISTDVRVISATNKELKKEIQKGNFREDVYYRLNVIPINLPPLREKKNDIPLLVDHFINKISKINKKSNINFSDKTISTMMKYNWPGNVRELENAVQYSIVRSRGQQIMPEHLPIEFKEKLGAEIKDFNQKLSIENVEAALKETGGNKSKAAKLLGVGRATLYRFLSSNNYSESIKEK